MAEVDRLIVNENEVLFNQTARTDTGTDPVVEFSEPVYYRGGITWLRHGFTNNDGEHEITLASDVTAGTGNWGPKPGLFYQKDGNNKVIVYGNVAFTPTSGTYKQLNGNQLPEDVRPDGGYALCLACGTTDAGYGYANPRILKIHINTNGNILCDGSTEFGTNTMDTTAITKCSIFCEFFCRSDYYES